MAQILGVGRTTVWRKLQKYKISVDDFRDSRKESTGAKD
jgi:DNA-binding NtrC family response regulator